MTNAQQKKTLSAHVEIDRTALTRGQVGIVNLLAEIKAETSGVEGERPPLSIVFTLDVSPSMHGEPLRQVIRSTERLIDLLRPVDSAAIVVFSNAAFVVAPLTLAAGRARESMKMSLRGLETTGAGTNIGLGLRLAAEALGKAPPGGRSAILLLSDGEPNVGLSSAEQLGGLARSLRPRASIATLGYGRQHDEKVLSAISDSGGGSYHFIPDPAVCQLELSKALGAQGDIVAERVELLVRAAPGVKVKRVAPIPGSHFVSGGQVIAFPDLGAGERRLELIELEVDPGNECRRIPLTDLELRYHPAGSIDVEQISTTAMIDVRTDSGSFVLSTLHKVLLVRADEVRSAARALGDRGDFRSAARMLKDTIAAIEGAPGYSAEGELFEAREQLVDDAALFAQEPDHEAWSAFKRGQRSALAGSGVAAGARQAKSPQARAIANAIAGKLAGCALVDPASGQRLILPAEAVIGRSRTCDIVVPSSQVSRQHAHVYAIDGDYFITCLGSANGVWVNGRRIDVHRLAEGDQVAVGDALWVFERRPEA